jgi:metallo-beta-lactamase family protein
LNLVAHIPRWKEQLVFKQKEVTLEKPPVEEPLYDVKTVMLNTIVDLENELKVLKKQIKSKEMEGKLGEGDRNRLEYIKEEIQSVLSK